MSVKLVLKLVVALLLLAVLVQRIDPSEVFGTIAGARAFPLFLAIAAGFGIVFADTAFWTVSMRAVGCRIDAWPALVFSLVGWFFANFAPSTVGADLFRAAQMRYAGAAAGTALRVVIAARLMSFAALLIVIAAGLPIAFRLVTGPVDRALLAGVFVAGTLGLTVFVVLGPSLSWLPARFSAIRARQVAALAGDLRVLLTGGSAALIGWVLSTVPHLLRVAAVAAVASSLNAPIDALALFALIPAALLLAMIPVSFGGWGVREASFVYFLGLAGIDAAMALAISIVYGLTRVVIGAIGGALWVVARKEHYRFAIDAAAPESFGAVKAGQPPR